MALVITVAMVLGLMSITAFADGPTEQDPDKGSITVKSPIMGAQYTGYRIFDLTINESGDSIAYSIDNDSPFYEAVIAYAEATKVTEGEGEDAVDKYALILTEVQTAATGEHFQYNVSANTDPAQGPVFDAQHFGQAMQAAIAAIEEEEETIDSDYVIYPDYTDTTANKVTLPDTDQITFKNIELGYYLITNKYPTEDRTASFQIPGESDPRTLTKDTTDEEIKDNADDYVDAVVTDDYVTQYIEDNNLKDKLVPAGRDMTAEEIASVKKQLQESTRQSAIDEQRAALEAIKGNASDINVKEPVLVFVDSMTKSAEIFEKNELDKWDVPVNPQGSADVEDLPEHGEPDGGKNIIVGYVDEEKTKPIYADWTEAAIGEQIHYELRVNAMNFIREDVENPGDDGVNNNSEFAVKQVREYIIGDYQDDSLTFDPAKDTITVKIVDDNGNIVKIDGVEQKWDYTSGYENFFLTDEQALQNGQVKDDILNTGGGIAIPWVGLTTDATEAAKHKNVTSYDKITTPDNPETTDEDETVYTTYYWYSIYDSDVTIVVDYTMTLTDKATIDAPGNINYSEYGVNFVDGDDDEYTPPTPETPQDKPDKTSEKDTATVYTYALAIQKVDENNEKLAGATFKIAGLTVSELDDGYYKVEAYDPDAEWSVELKADDEGLLVIEGFRASTELTVKEIQAPDGYNLLTSEVTMNPVKVGEEVVTTAKTTYYSDEDKTTVVGTEETTTSEKNYYNASGEIIAKSVTVGSGDDAQTTYYDSDGAVISAATFSSLINAATAGEYEGKEVTSAKLAPLAVYVENKKGTELPSTGGIGTTIFYVVGAILVLGAGVVLITRRRMDG